MPREIKLYQLDRDVMGKLIVMMARTKIRGNVLGVVEVEDRFGVTPCSKIT